MREDIFFVLVYIDGDSQILYERIKERLCLVQGYNSETLSRYQTYYTIKESTRLATTILNSYKPILFSRQNRIHD